MKINKNHKNLLNSYSLWTSPGTDRLAGTAAVPASKRRARPSVSCDSPYLAHQNTPPLGMATTACLAIWYKSLMFHFCIFNFYVNSLVRHKFFQLELVFLTRKKATETKQFAQTWTRVKFVQPTPSDRKVTLFWKSWNLWCGYWKSGGYPPGSPAELQIWAPV